MLNSWVQFIILAIVVGIPFYFQYWAAQNQGLELREINSKVSKLAFLDLACLFISSFLSVNTKTDPQQLIFAGATFFSLMLLYSFRSKVSQAKREVVLTATERFTQSARKFLGFGFILGVNYGITYVLAPFTGMFAAVALAITAMVACAPLMVRILYSTTPMHASRLKEEIQTLFNNAGVHLGEIHLMDTNKQKVSNALVCGTKFGFGPFKRSLFLTENLFEVLSEEELKAVLCHEASHFQLHHVAKRAASSFVIFAVALIAVSLPIGMLMTQVKSEGWLAGLTLFGLFANIAFQFSSIFRVIRKQEFEADLNAVVLGANPAALVSSLEKITDFNGGSRVKDDFFTRLMSSSGHPTLEERSEAILSHRMPQTVNLLPAPRFIAAYFAIVGLIGSYYFTSERSQKTAHRAIASETISTDQSSD